MRRLSIPALIALTVAAPASAGMTVGTFVTKANALRANPLTAIASPDLPLLRAQAQAATRELKADRDARKAAGKPPIACPSQGQSIGIMEMLDGLAALPAADRKLPLKDGYAKVIAKHYPCR